MCRFPRNVRMLHNVKKNDIDVFEVHVHVSSLQMHVYVQLQINLKCTDARASTDNMIIHACTFGTPNCWKKRQVTLIRGFNSFTNTFVIGLFKYTCTRRESLPTNAAPILLKKTRFWDHLTFITQILVLTVGLISIPSRSMSIANRDDDNEKHTFDFTKI